MLVARLLQKSKAAQAKVTLDLNFVVVGDTKTGKTAFVEGLLFQSEASYYMPTLLDSYNATCLLEITSTLLSRDKKLKRCTVNMIDTSGKFGLLWNFWIPIKWPFVLGMRKFDRVRSIVYKHQPSVILVFDVTRPATFQSIVDHVCFVMRCHRGHRSFLSSGTMRYHITTVTAQQTQQQEQQQQRESLRLSRW